MLRQSARVLLALALILVLDWEDWTPPYPQHTVAQVKAQQPAPPNAWHPYRGGTNCVQVADANGNFSCSPLVTIDPLTGNFVSSLGGPISTALGPVVIAPLALQSTLRSLGNDVVIAKSATTIASFGPGVGGLTIRVRPSPLIPGYCRLVVVAGNSGVEFAVALLNPAYPFPVSGSAAPAIAPLIDAFQVDLPGGPSGC